MNLAESIKFVLKTKGPELFTGFWQDDLPFLARGLVRDISHSYRNNQGKWKAWRQSGFTENLQSVKDSTADTFTILQVMPGRIKEAFSNFREDFLQELEKMTDSKQKTIFSIKVMAALSSFAVGAFYGLRRPQQDLKFHGVRPRSAFTQFLLKELVLRMSQLFILRLLSEIEKELSDDGDLKKIKFFKSLLTSEVPKEAAEDLEAEHEENGDKALEIVDSLKNYIATGRHGS